MKTVLVALVVVAIGCGVAGVVVLRRQAAQQAAFEKAKAERRAELERRALLERLRQQERLAPAPAPPTAAPAAPEPAPPEATPPAVPSAPPPELAKAGVPIKVTPPAPMVAAPPAPAPRGTKPSLQDPLARVALSFVGFDRDAEGVWVEAINNPDLPANERKDLIEDLNEDGFPDPKNITADDLPLILSRIVLIEEHAFSAMDDVNAAAFQEAYKDLVNMYARIAQR